MELLRSGDNLQQFVKSFIQVSREVIIYSPFIRVNMLDEILGDVPCKIVVVRWQTSDILFGVSDFEDLYNYCQRKHISLYRNLNIHLKVIQNERDELVLGSANVTNKGMGDSNFNMELSAHARNLELEDLTYLKRIINNSELVDEVYFEELKSKIDERRIRFNTPEVIEEIELVPRQKDFFLLSSLPMSENPNTLFEIYSKKENTKFTQEEIDCAAHDLANFSIHTGLIEREFFSDLKLAFNTQPFVVKLKNVIRDEGSMRYGSVVKWIIENTSTVPTPRSWELKQEQIVNILYEWICIFDSRYSWDKPNHSQIIHFKGN